MFAAAQPPWLMVLAVEYRGRKLHGVPLQSAIEVFMKPLPAEASMNPVRPEVRSRTWVSSAPAFLLSKIRIWSLSPGFISSVRWFGVDVLRLAKPRVPRPGGDAVGWDEGEVNRLDAVVVADGSVGRALQRVDGQRRAPVGVVAAEAVGERGEPGRVELQLPGTRNLRPGSCHAVSSCRCRACRAAAGKNWGRTGPSRTTASASARRSA